MPAIATKRGGARGRKNLFGMGSRTYSPTANKKAFAAGKAAGDTWAFGNFWKRGGYEAKGFDRSALEKEFERGVNAGIDEKAAKRLKVETKKLKSAGRLIEQSDVAELQRLMKAEKISLAEAAGRLGVKLNPKHKAKARGSKSGEKALYKTAARLAMLGAGGVPAVLLANPKGKKVIYDDLVWTVKKKVDGKLLISRPDEEAFVSAQNVKPFVKNSGTDAVAAANPSGGTKKYEGKFALYGGKSGLIAYGVTKARAIAMAKRFTADTGIVATMSGQKIAEYSRGKKVPSKKNPGTDAAAAAYREFHGRAPEERIEFTSTHRFPAHTAAIGDLVELTIKPPKERGLRDRYVDLADFGEAWLTRHPKMKQLYVEGGDQSIDLDAFGLDDSDPHEVEYLGELVRCVYFTRKDHLGKDGGEANYHHRFGKNELTLDKTELIKVGYHVPDEQLIFVGGGYEIPAEGIDG